MAPIMKGRLRSGLASGSAPLPLLGSGKARLSASFTPNAMAFSSAMPMAVGTAPFQKALTPSSDEVLATVLKIPE